MKDSYLDKGRKNQKQKTRHQILQSAKWFLSHGKEFTLDDVAEKASISRATVYRYFSNTEVLSREAALDLSTRSPQEVVDSISSRNLDELLLEIQNYYNNLSLNNESAFRKYLSVVIAAPKKGRKRGARRPKAIQLALDKYPDEISKGDKERLAVIAATLMGIEPLIVTKDVCQLDNEASKEILRWGLELMLKGLRS